MKPINANIENAIHEYYRQFPDGLDVTAHVLNEIGESDMAAYNRATKKSMDQAKQDLGRDVSEKYLPKLFPSMMGWTLRKLDLVTVDSKKWPNLNWVSSYTQHERSNGLP